MTKLNPLQKIRGLGQSVWLDYLQRDFITSGQLKRLIEEDGLLGMTSNPSIFDKAIEGNESYEEDIRSLVEAGKTEEEIYQALTVKDIQMAADEFRMIYEKHEFRNGYVSLEVNPHLAHDTDGTIDEARHLWKTVNRPNIFIKIPATVQGLPAIHQCLCDGININITLLFGIPRYREVAEAYMMAMEDRVRRRQSLDHVASVASFFLSRIDVLVDEMLEEKIRGGGPDAQLAGELRGEVAIASARLAYRIYEKLFSSARFTRLASKGAQPQRLLWASTSTKNPEYNDLKYVDALVGPETVNTMPMNTLDACRDHGRPDVRLKTDIEKAQRVMKSLIEIDINIDLVTQQLEDEGVDKFIAPYDHLLSTLAEKIRSLRIVH